jgi:Domain of unknown function (DUF4386)
VFPRFLDSRAESLPYLTNSGDGHAPLDSGPVRPNRYARIGGALYLVIIVAGIVGPLLTRDPLIVPNDADATAHNIATSPMLWQLGIAVDVVMQLCDVPVMLILFLLLSPVNRTLALLTLLFNLIQTATLVANQLTLVAAQLLSTSQPALTETAIQAYSYGEALGLIFFGFTLLSEGYLIRHSGYLPWFLGLLVQVAGVGYVVNSFLLLVAADLANIAFLIPSFVAELSLALWLLIKGVDTSKWDLRVPSTLAT